MTSKDETTPAEAFNQHMERDNVDYDQLAIHRPVPANWGTQPQKQPVQPNVQNSSNHLVEALNKIRNEGLEESVATPNFEVDSSEPISDYLKGFKG